MTNIATEPAEHSISAANRRIEAMFERYYARQLDKPKRSIPKRSQRSKPKSRTEQDTSPPHTKKQRKPEHTKPPKPTPIKWYSHIKGASISASPTDIRALGMTIEQNRYIAHNTPEGIILAHSHIAHRGTKWFPLRKMVNIKINNHGSENWLPTSAISISRTTATLPSINHPDSCSPQTAWLIAVCSK